MGAILTGTEHVEEALRRTLEREGCTSDQGCSALANVLLAALVKCKRDPRVSRNVSAEMQRLAGVLMDLAATGDEGLSRVLSDATSRLGSARRG